MRILALAYSFRTEVEGIAPFARAIEQAGGDFQFALLPAMRETAEREKVRCAYMPENFRPARAVGESREAIEFLKRFFAEIGVGAFVADRKIPGRLFEPWLRAQLPPKRLENVFSYYSFAEQMIERFEPDWILLPNSWSLEGFGARQIAAKHGIPTAVVPTYFTQLSHLSSSLIEQIIEHAPDRWGVMGQRVQNELMRAGIPPERICITNLPKFDLALTAGSSQDAAIIWRERASAATKCRHFLLYTQQNFIEESTIVELLMEYLRDLPDVALIIRPHPVTRRKLSLKTRMKIACSRRVLVDRKTPFNTALRACDALITATSISAYEAIVLDKPVIGINFSSRRNPYLFAEYGAVREIDHPAELADAVRGILRDTPERRLLEEGRRRLLSDFTPPNDRSSEQLLRSLFSYVELNAAHAM